MRALLVFALVAVPALAQPTGPWPVSDCGLEPPGTYVDVPVPTRDWEPNLDAASPPLVRVERRAARFGQPNQTLGGEGALGNKVIYLSPGHGFTWDVTSNNWRTQRGNTNAIVEDLVSVETLSQFLMPMLLNAGAQVIPVRELDRNPNLVIVDNDGPGYVESGGGFQTSAVDGWRTPAFPMTGELLPFTTGTNRLMNTAATQTASATWTAQLPEAGFYDVSIAYTAFTARVTDAHFVVRHAGGETHFRVNQQRHGGTWVQLGRFYFQQGAAQVVALNDSTSSSGSNVSLDAVKFGGGMGLIDRGGGTSGRLRCEESARYQAQWAGAPLSVWAPSSNTPAADRDNDVSTRSRFAAWVHEPGEDAIYVAWHTNAFDGTAVGTTTYVYGPNPPDGTLQFSGVDGGLELAGAVNAQLINDFRQDAGWNLPTWRDRGVKSGYFGEINPSRNGEMPSILIEVAFHDSPIDAASIKEPQWRYIAARAIAQGIVTYFAHKDGVAVKLFPEPPTHVSAVNQGNGEAVLRWRVPPTDAQGVRGHAATGFRVYSSADGQAWDDGYDVVGTSARVTIPPDAARFFRVTATNAGGESFPSSVVGVRAPVPGKPLVLVVDGFDRLEAAIGKVEAFAAKYALGNVLRIWLAQMNDATAARLTGAALADNEVGFDTADSDAVSAGDVPTAPYQLLAWYVGRGKQGGLPLSLAEQAAVSGFRARGVPVFFSGDGTADAQFVADVFSGAVNGDLGGLTVDGLGALMGLDAIALDDGTRGSFNAGTPPSVDPQSAAVVLGRYANNATAAIGVPSQTVFFGFPFETIVVPATRTEVMKRVLAFLGPEAFDGGLIEVDAGSVVDAGQEPPVDAGQPNPPDDAGAALDGGVPGADGGVLPEDGGAGLPDGGSPVALELRGGGCGCTTFPLSFPLLALWTLLRRRLRFTSP